MAGRSSRRRQGQGVVMSPKQYWRRFTPGLAAPNVTTPDRDADVAGAPVFHDNRVAVIACGEQELASPPAENGISGRVGGDCRFVIPA